MGCVRTRFINSKKNLIRSCHEKMYYNKEYRKAFKKSDCPEDLGSEETFIVHEAEFCSDISQDDADRKAEEFAEKEGPLYANKVGGCCKVYYNTRQEGDFFKNDCPDGQNKNNPHITW